MDSLDTIKALIDPKIYKILRLFLDNKDELFNLNVISSKTKVPIASTFRIVNKILRLNIISIVKVGRTKLYKLNKNSAIKGDKI